MAVDKATLLAAGKLHEETVEVPDVGTVTVRGLSRGEVFKLQQKALNPDDLEVHLLVRGMVDPELTKDEVVTWRDEAMGDVIDPISTRIMELSGLAPGQQTQKERNFRPGPDEG